MKKRVKPLPRGTFQVAICRGDQKSQKKWGKDCTLRQGSNVTRDSQKIRREKNRKEHKTKLVACKILYLLHRDVHFLPERYF